MAAAEDQYRPAHVTRWLVLGAGGQLGSDLVAVLRQVGQEVDGRVRSEVDITDPDAVAAAVRDSAPDVVVNAAAFTAVDRAETEEAAAWAVNGRGPELIAEQVAARPTTTLIHISTDYVFAGDATAPYAEDAPTHPATAYGRTKLVGEQAVRRILPDRGFVLRTAWLYGDHGPNFVTTMLRLAAQGDPVSVVTDQIGQPTWSRDLAGQIQELVAAAGPAGIYHATNAGSCSWYELARRTFTLAGSDPDRVLPTTTAAFPRPAPRPAYSVLAHDGWIRAGIAPMRRWQDALADAVPRLIDRSRGDVGRGDS